MAINHSSIASQSVEGMQLAILQIVTVRPEVNEILDPPQTPGMLVGYYSAETDKVELFTISPGGTFWVKAG